MSSPEYHPRMEKGDESYPSREEVAYFQRILRHPEVLPEQFWRAVIQKVALNGEPISYTQVQGLTRFAFGNGSALPDNPSEAQFFSLNVSAGVVWNFRYNSQSASTYKWEFVGGPPMVHSVGTEQSTTSTTDTDLTTDGPTLTMPFAGEYLATAMCHGRSTGAGATVAAALYANGSWVSEASANVTDSLDGSELPRAHFVTLAGPNQVIKMRYRTSAGTGLFRYRLLFVTPVRIG